MKKTLKAVLSILLVLALLAMLPLTAMAENIGTEGEHPSATVVDENNKEIENNYGTVQINRPTTTGSIDSPTIQAPGKITNNHGVVGSNRMDQNTDTVPGTITNNYGTVNENRATITNNGKPQDDGTQFNPASGIVGHNNLYDAYIDNNYGTVIINGNSSGSPTINNNYGLVQENTYAKVITNQAGGTIQSNSGLVGEKNKYGALITSGTSGNCGIVTNNNEGGEVCNREGGEVTYNSGRVENYGGTVVNNNAGGTVQYNEAGSTVMYNHGSVGTGDQGGNGNLGTVEYNYIDGVVYNIEDRGEKGTVTTNFGTVHQYNSTTDGTTTTSTTTTYYGLQAVDDEENGAQHYLGSYASDPDKTINLESKLTDIKREGFKLVSYTPYTYNKNSSSEDHLEPLTSGNPIFVGEENDTDFTSYHITAPTLLKLTWEKITSIFKPASTASSGGAGEVELSAKKHYIGLGSVIFINEKGYKVVEIKDDAYVVVSFDALSDEDVKDLDALFAKLFTAEQQKLIKNVGQLLDAEDVLAVFGKPGNHPVFEISKALTE